MGLREEVADIVSLYGMALEMSPHAMVPHVVSANIRPGRRANEKMLSVIADEEGERFVTTVQAPEHLLLHYAHGLKELLRGMIRRMSEASQRAAAGDVFTDIAGIGEGPEAEGLLRSFLTKNKLRVKQQEGGHWTGCVVVNTSLGEITLCATVSPEVIQAVLENVKGLHEQLHADAVAQGCEGEAVAGNIFSAIGKLARKIARGRLLQRLGSALKAIARNPIISKAVGIVSSVVPGMSAVRLAVTSASNVLGQLRAGNPQTRRRVTTLVQQARQGNPQARRTVRILSAVNKRPVAASAVGFWYHRPMRPTSALWSARDTYLKGLGQPTT